MAKPWFHCCKDCGTPISLKYVYCARHSGKKYSNPIRSSNDIFKRDKYHFKYKHSATGTKTERGCKLDD